MVVVVVVWRSLVVVLVLVVYLLVSLFVFPVHLSICLSAGLKTKPFCEASYIFERGNVKNEAILRDPGKN